jgi:hypothetical protein
VLGVLLGLAAAALLRSRWYHGKANMTHNPSAFFPADCSAAMFSFA